MPPGDAWTEAEGRKLIQLVRRHGNDWNTVAHLLGTDRSPNEVQQQYHKLVPSFIYPHSSSSSSAHQLSSNISSLEISTNSLTSASSAPHNDGFDSVSTAKAEASPTPSNASTPYTTFGTFGKKTTATSPSSEARKPEGMSDAEWAEVRPKPINAATAAFMSGPSLPRSSSTTTPTFTTAAAASSLNDHEDSADSDGASASKSSNDSDDSSSALGSPTAPAAYSTATPSLSLSGVPKPTVPTTAPTRVPAMFSNNPGRDRRYNRAPFASAAETNQAHLAPVSSASNSSVSAPPKAATSFGAAKASPSSPPPSAAKLSSPQLKAPVSTAFCKSTAATTTAPLNSSTSARPTVSSAASPWQSAVGRSSTLTAVVGAPSCSSTPSVSTGSNGASGVTGTFGKSTATAAPLAPSSSASPTAAASAFGAPAGGGGFGQAAANPNAPPNYKPTESSESTNQGTIKLAIQAINAMDFYMAYSFEELRWLNESHPATQPAQQAQAAGGFGQAAGGFGQRATAQTFFGGKPVGGGFGTAGAAAGGRFGAKAVGGFSSTSAAAGGFGAKPTAAVGGFGGAAKTGFGSAAGATSGFGAKAVGGGFGSTAASTGFGAKSAGGGFGATGAVAGGGFGQRPAAGGLPASPTGGGFRASTIARSSPLPSRELYAYLSFEWSPWHTLVKPDKAHIFDSLQSTVECPISESKLPKGTYGVYELGFGTIRMLTVYIGYPRGTEDLRSTFSRLSTNGAHLRDLLLPYLRLNLLNSTLSVRWIVTTAESKAKDLRDVGLLTYDYAFQDAPATSRPPLCSPSRYLLDELLEAKRASLSANENQICQLYDHLELPKQSSLLMFLQQDRKPIKTVLKASEPTEEPFVFPPPPPLKKKNA